MDFRASKFYVSTENIQYYLGLPLDVEVDEWTEKVDKNYVDWKAEISTDKEGIRAIDSTFKELYVKFYWSIMLEDLTDEQAQMLLYKFDAQKLKNRIEGDFYIYTLKHKHFQIEMDLQYNNQLKVQEVIFDFLDNNISII